MIGLPEPTKHDTYRQASPLVAGWSNLVYIKSCQVFENTGACGATTLNPKPIWILPSGKCQLKKIEVKVSFCI